MITHKNRHSKLARHLKIVTVMCTSKIIYCPACHSATEYMDMCGDSYKTMSVMVNANDLWCAHDETDLSLPTATIKFIVCNRCTTKWVNDNKNITEGMYKLEYVAENIYWSMVQDGAKTMVIDTHCNGVIVTCGSELAEGKHVVTMRRIQ